MGVREGLLEGVETDGEAVDCRDSILGRKGFLSR